MPFLPARPLPVLRRSALGATPQTPTPIVEAAVPRPRRRIGWALGVLDGAACGTALALAGCVASGLLTASAAVDIAGYGIGMLLAAEALIRLKRHANPHFAAPLGPGLLRATVAALLVTLPTAMASPGPIPCFGPATTVMVPGGPRL